MSPTLPWQDSTDPTYADTAAKDFVVVLETKTLVVLRGRCPRCEGLMDVNLVPATFRSTVTSPPSAPWTRLEPVTCKCTEHQHPGRPADETTGCGAHWIFDLTEETP